MVSLKKEKTLGFIFTLIAALLYVFIFVLVVLVKLEDDTAVSIETMTLMSLQTLSFVILLLGIAFHKENLILGTLAASLVASAVSYVVNQVSSLVASPLDFQKMEWFFSTAKIGAMVADGFLSVGAVIFLVYLLLGRHKLAMLWSRGCFYAYLAFAIVSLGFLSVGLFQNAEVYLVYFISLCSSLLVNLAYIVDINAYFFRKKTLSLLDSSTLSKEEKKERRVASNGEVENLEATISAYQKTYLAPCFKTQDNRLVLTVDLQGIDLYEPCSSATLLNGSIYSFVEDIAFLLAEGEELSLHFLYKEGTSEEEKKKIQTLFKAHYAILYKNVRDRLSKEMILAIIFVFIGFLLIAFHLPYVNANSNSVYGEMLDIFGWVFTWEAVEILAVNSLANSSEVRKYKALYSAQVAD